VHNLVLATTSTYPWVLFIATKPSRSAGNCSNGKTYLKLNWNFELQLTNVMEDL
jgi:hypothetical protein